MLERIACVAACATALVVLIGLALMAADALLNYILPSRRKR